MDAARCRRLPMPTWWQDGWSRRIFSAGRSASTLGAPLGLEYSITVRETAPELQRLQARARPLVTRARAELMAHGAKPAEIKTDLRADVRYRGQSYEIEVALGLQFVSEFHQAHRR